MKSDLTQRIEYAKKQGWDITWFMSVEFPSGAFHFKSPDGLEGNALVGEEFVHLLPKESEAVIGRWERHESGGFILHDGTTRWILVTPRHLRKGSILGEITEPKLIRWDVGGEVEFFDLDQIPEELEARYRLAITELIAGAG